MDTETFAAMAETAAKVLRHNPTLGVATVEIAGSMKGLDGEFRDVVAIQNPPGDVLRQMALWALAFGSPLRVLNKRSHVEVTTEAIVDGHTVVVWDHVPPAVVARLLLALHLTSVESLATLEPAVLLAFDEPSGVAS